MDQRQGGTIPVRKRTSLEEGALRMYGDSAKSKSNGHGYSLDWALGSTLGRLEKRVADDPEKLARLRQQRRELSTFLADRNVDPQDAHAMLSALVDHQTWPRSADALQKRWQGDRGYEAIRLAAGGAEGAKQILTKADEFYRAIAKASPTFAHDAKESGAAELPEIIQMAAKYGTPAEERQK